MSALRTLPRWSSIWITARRIIVLRTQFMQRMVEFVHQYHVHVRLAYYPPYHSKYNPIERCWGILENHRNGALLDSIEAVLAFTRTMTWNGIHPVVELVTTTYQTGVKLTKEAMDRVEAQLQRRSHPRKSGLWTRSLPSTDLLGYIIIVESPSDCSG